MGYVKREGNSENNNSELKYPSMKSYCSMYRKIQEAASKRKSQTNYKYQGHFQIQLSLIGTSNSL